VTIPVASSDTGEGTVSTASLIFSPGGALSQTVIVTGVDDPETDGDQAYFVTLGTVSTTDGRYLGIDPPDVSLTNLDDESFVSERLPFETATLGATGQGPGSGFGITNLLFLGAKLTLTGTSNITSLGGHFVGSGASTKIFVAILPLNGSTDLPNTPLNPAEALFSTTFNAPATSAEVSIPTNFQLPPGRYAILFGSGFFGATGAAVMPGNDTDVGAPEYFYSPNTVGNSYVNGGFSRARMFVNGALVP
jgi:hypothetical protein